MKKYYSLCLLFVLCFTVGCAQVPTDPQALAVYRENNDPLEPMNRAVFNFNLKADKYVLRPVVNGYRAVTTKGFRTKTNTMLENLKVPLTVVNDILQLNFKNAALDTSRFIINSTLGFFGVFDVAEKMGIAPNSQGFGNTLGVWNVPSGPYLVLPLLGPSNVRDTSGLLVGYFADPLTYVAYKNDNKDVSRGLFGLSVLETIVGYENAIDLLDAGRMTSLDFYAFMRSSYSQYRTKTIDEAKGIKPENGDTASYDFDLDEDFDIE